MILQSAFSFCKRRFEMYGFEGNVIVRMFRVLLKIWFERLFLLMNKQWLFHLEGSCEKILCFCGVDRVMVFYDAGIIC